MNSEQSGRARSLREIELEVEAEGREWTRRRLQQRLQEEVERHGEVFPPQRSKADSLATPRDANAQRRGGG
jgi:hypothetical protein